jgi:hypothetical protein
MDHSGSAERGCRRDLPCSAQGSLSLLGVGAPATFGSDEEFVGPFASWANVKTNYGAAGDGATDDSAAIQKALNALSSTNPTLYFPAGTYLITQTLTLSAKTAQTYEYMSVIGQDPANTTISGAAAAAARCSTSTGTPTRALTG